MLTPAAVTPSAAPDPFFAGVEPTPVRVVHEGRQYELALPLRYHDWTLMFANFPAPTRRVREVLPSPKLVPVEIVPGLSVVTLVAFAHKQVDGLAPYNEIAVMMPVRCQPRWNVPLLPLLFPQRFPDLGFWVEHLPVTTVEACDAGIALWGFPKVVHEITFEERDGVRRCRWSDGGTEIMVFEMRVPSRFTSRRIDFVAYPRQAGTLGRTLFQTKAPYFETRWPGGATFRLGDGEIARRLRRLGMWRFAIGRLFAPSGLSMLHGPSERIPV
jgi:hypothetical protein